MGGPYMAGRGLIMGGGRGIMAGAGGMADGPGICIGIPLLDQFLRIITIKDVPNVWISRQTRR
jgi:hypothetical protein